MSLNKCLIFTFSCYLPAQPSALSHFCNFNSFLYSNVVFIILFDCHSFKKTQMWSELCFVLAFNFPYLTFAHFFLVYLLFTCFYLCSFLSNLFFLWSSFFLSVSFGCFQLSNMKQLLGRCSQLGKPSLWLLFSTGGGNPKLWFPSICPFQVLSPLPSTSPTISILLLNLPLLL